MKGRKKGVYALYKGEECLSIGTKEEISKELNITMQTLNFYTTKAYQKRIEKQRHLCKDGFRELIRIDEDEEE